MPHNTDILKKKVCVTVFLDELFEEVPSDDSTNQLPLVESSEIESVKIQKISSERETAICDPVPISNDYLNIEDIDARPRKHRREAKFSKNPCKILKNLNKYRKSEELEVRDSKSPQRLPSGYCESGADDFLLMNKKRKSISLTDKNKIETAKSSCTSNVVHSKSKSKRKSSKTSDVNCQYDVTTYSSKSIQVNGHNTEASTNTELSIGGTVCFLEEEQKKIVEDLAWEKTKNQIKLILAKANDWYEMKESCEGDRMQQYNLKSILDECEKPHGRTGAVNREAYSMTGVLSSEFCESDIRVISDSYTCVFPHNKKGISLKERGLKRVSNKIIRMKGFESDASELECFSYNGLPRLDYNPLLCYTSCINCKTKEEGNDSLHKICWNESVNSHRTSNLSPVSSFGGSSTVPTLELISSKFSGNETILKEHISINKPKSLSKTNLDNLLMSVSEEINNIMYDDDSKTLLKSDIYSENEENNVRVCKEIFNKVSERHFSSKCEFGEDKKEVSNVLNKFSICEVFVKRKVKDKILSDEESETIFAESLQTSESTDGEVLPPTEEDNMSEFESKKVNVMEFEGALLRPNILKRMRTIELVGNGSSSELQNLSTEVILVCENISNEDLCLEAWQSSSSTMGTPSKTCQCYLKDSADSSMYLIEIPFRFTRSKVK
ncbi:hypothetical protein RUM44_012500 [Polyplax serrata]|uniref:Uncharacterized protein n=1 Tax=Polyplax serrata TaxID=468196 RepID=A0ABR1BBG5_POLSC